MSGGARPVSVRRYRMILAAVVVFGNLACVLFPPLSRWLGWNPGKMWFLDSYAILAASDAVQAGLDPYVAMPADPEGRLHSYSTWWFVLGGWGLTVDDNFLFGGLCVAGFFSLVFAWLRPASPGEIAWFAALLLSPPVLLLVYRANNDLVVFTLLLAALAWLRADWGRVVAAIAALVLATGLKFYPVVAIAGFLVLRPFPRAAAAFGLATCVVGATFLLVFRDFLQAAFPPAAPLFTFGASTLLLDLGVSAGAASIAGTAVLAGAGVLAWWCGWTRGLDEPSTGTLGDRALFVAGSCVLLGCFVAGVSYFYRWVFALALAPWLWRQACMAGAAGRVARVAMVLLLVCLWMDSGFTLVDNSFGPFLRDELLRRARNWKIVSQPLVWALMGLLAGWLLDLALSAWRRRREPAADGGQDTAARSVAQT